MEQIAGASSPPSPPRGSRGRSTFVGKSSLPLASMRGSLQSMASGLMRSVRRSTVSGNDYANTMRIVRATLSSMERGVTGRTVNWPAVFIGALMVVATSGQGLFLSVADARLEACGAGVSETMFLSDSLLVAASGLVLLGIMGWRSARGGGCCGDKAQSSAERKGAMNGMLVPRCRVVKFMVVGAIGTVDNIMYLQAMTYHNPAAVMILRLACSLVILTLSQIALKMLKSTGIQIFGLVPLVLAATTHIMAAAAESTGDAGGKPQISVKVFDLVVLILCPFTAAAEVLGTDLLFTNRGNEEEAPARTESAAVEPHPVLPFLLNSAGAALMDACIHIGLNKGHFPVNSFGCRESMFLILIAAAYVCSYKLAMIFCGGTASVVLRVLNPMVTYMATCLVLQNSPDLQRSVSGLTVLTWVVWYNVAPLWDSQTSTAVRRRTIATALMGIEGKFHRQSLARRSTRGAVDSTSGAAANVANIPEHSEPDHT